MNDQSSILDVLWQLAFHVKIRCKRAVQQYGLDLNGMHVRTLRLLQSHPGCTAIQLCEISGRDKAQITRLLKDLEARGLIRRQPHPHDRRSQTLSLTSSAEALMARIRAAENEVEEQYVTGLSEQELQAFRVTARKMLANLRECQD